jgi:hypothetical protein
MTACVGAIILGEPQPIKSSELGIFGLAFFMMFVQRLELVSNVKNFLESSNSNLFPLKPVVVSGPFQQWGLDFIGEIHPTSSGQHRWILTASDYFTKWIEAIPTRSASHQVNNWFS